MKKYLQTCVGFISALIMTVAAVADAAAFSDVTSSTPYKDSITTLTTIGLIKGYEDNTFRPDNNITRAEFTTMIVRALGMEDEQGMGYETDFVDLIGHYSRFNVKTAQDMGIIDGFEDGTFRPDENVTYEQAMKMVVCTLGYGETALADGGYPMGYLTVGGKLGLTHNISIENSAPATRGVIAKLIDNALTVKMQKPTVMVNGEIKYVQSDETLLKDKLKIEHEKVLVTGVGDNTITNDKDDDDLHSYEMRVARTKDDSKIVLDFSELFKDYDEVDKYLGHIIYVFYKDVDDDDDGDDLLIAIDDQTETSVETTITSRDIDSYNTSNKTLKYDAGDKTLKSVKIKPNEMSIVYNGRAANKTDTVYINGKYYSMSDAVNEMLNPESDCFLRGEIRIIDSENDGDADVIFITNYELMVASSTPNSTDYRLTDKLVSGNYMILDPDDDNINVTYKRNGSKVAGVTSLKANDVVLYAKSADGDYMTINATANAVTGSITDTDGNEVTINGKTYYISDECRKYAEDTSKIKVGATGTFYPDCYDNIIFATLDTVSTSVYYAYIINSAVNDETGDEYVSLYAPSVSTSGATRYGFADKVSVNGQNTSREDVIDKLEKTSEYNRADIENKDKVYTVSTTQPSANDVAQLVKYSLKKDEVSEIITLEDEGGTGEINTSADKLVRYKPLAKYTYSANNNFSNEFYINSSTTIIYVPGSRTARADYQKYTASTIFKTNQSYWVEPYDVNESKVASLVIMYGNSSLADITKDTVMSVVAKAPTEIDLSGETVNKMTMYNSSTSLVTKNTDDNKEFADTVPGDIIQYGQSNNTRMINRHNVISAADVINVLNSSDKTFDWTDDKFEYTFINDDGNVEWDSETNTAYSRAFIANVVEAVSEGDDSYIRVTRHGFGEDGAITETDEERYTITSKTPIIRFTTSKDQLSAYVDGTTSKLGIDDFRDAKNSGKDCSKIFIYTIKGTVKFIMIYE